MLGFLGIFGRARELKDLEGAFRRVDLHPMLVHDSVKLTIVRLLRERGLLFRPEEYARVAELIAYCMLGADAFASANGADRARAVEGRIDAALEAGDSLDARLVLLTLHAGVLQPSVVDRFGLASEDTG